MSQDVSTLVERLFEALISGDRRQARVVVAEAIRSAGDLASPALLISGLYWPAYELIERLYRNDQLTRLSYQLSTRLLRKLVDGAGAELSATPPNRANARRIFAACGPTEGDELGAQMAIDLIEAAGYEVTFAGGGLPSDEIMAQVHESKPDILLLFASGASDLPGIRGIIDTLRSMNASPNTRVVVGGGVFNRAEGLAEEINVDLYCATPMQLVETLASHPVIERASAKPKLAPQVRKRRAA